MPIWDAPIELVNRIYTLAYIGLILGAGVTLIATMTLFWSSAVRDKYAEGQISTAQVGAATANEKAGAANERAAGLEVRAAELEKEGVNLRLALEASKAETLRISQGLASRHVLAAQKALIESALRGMRFSMTIMNWSQSEPEVIAYRDELAAAFSVPGVDVQVGTNTIIPAQVGLVVLDQTDSRDSAVARALEASGIEFEYHRVDIPTPTIRVGIKKPAL